MNLSDWVEKATDIRDINFRKTVHLVLKAISNSEQLSKAMAFKGGLLLGIKYHSERYTTDLDFSTEMSLNPNDINDFKETFDSLLNEAETDLIYGIKCKIQKIQKQPKQNEAKFPSLKITIGYVEKNDSPSSLEKYDMGMSPHIISIDYSFNETTGFVEEINIDDDSTIICYSLVALVSEKLRSILQQVTRNRSRGQDIYDINYLLTEYNQYLNEENVKNNILNSLKNKSIDKNIDAWLNIHGMKDTKIKDHARRDYQSIKIIIGDELPDFDSSYAYVQTYFESLPW